MRRRKDGVEQKSDTEQLRPRSIQEEDEEEQKVAAIKRRYARKSTRKRAEENLTMSAKADMTRPRVVSDLVKWKSTPSKDCYKETRIVYM